MKKENILHELVTHISKACLADKEKLKHAIDYYQSNRRYIIASQDVFDILKTLKKVELADMFVKKKKISIGDTVRSRLNGRMGTVISIGKDGFTVEVKWSEGGTQILPIELLYILTKSEQQNFKFPLRFERPLDEGTIGYDDIGKTPTILKKKTASMGTWYRVLPYSDFITYITRIASNQTEKITKDDMIHMVCAFYDMPEIAIKRAYFVLDKVTPTSSIINSSKYLYPEVCLFENKKECLGNIFIVTEPNEKYHVALA